jgi:hypothetical protein
MMTQPRSIFSSPAAASSWMATAIFAPRSRLILKRQKRRIAVRRADHLPLGNTLPAVAQHTLQERAGRVSDANRDSSGLTIRSVRANPLTGSLMVVHDGSAASRKAIMQTLEHFSRAPVEGEVPHPVMAPSFRKPSAESLAKRVAKIGLEQAVSNIAERAIQIAAAALL